MMDYIYLTYLHLPVRNIKNEQPHVGRTLAARRSVTSCNVKITPPLRISAYSIFSGSVFFQYINEFFCGEQEKNPLFV